ncbi:hypothetical protein Rhow_006722 [Rhodococcus wratislaviensis]|uniref:Uncharacterized protein n=1 Tax=Rhodococcus wratislaviensis TaxID=44752 RepID=A0A402CG69_RHOWR|nr:hypothetical protein Rhow_006722 [Rhodococcus wratislaviensis]
MAQLPAAAFDQRVGSSHGNTRHHRRLITVPGAALLLCAVILVEQRRLNKHGHHP